MHENRHFLSYRKRRHDAENHAPTLDLSFKKLGASEIAIGEMCRLMAG